jgi:hypothetical protein
MNRYTSLYLNKLAATLNPDDIVVPQKERGPFSGVVSDLLLLPESHRRSGRISGMQEAAGEDPTMTQRYPATSRSLKSFAGLGIGGGLGALLGSAVASQEGTNRGTGAVGGALVGGISGTLAGVILDVIQKRRAEEDALNQVRDSNDLDLRRIEKGNILASLVSGMHQKGRSEVAKALSGGGIKKNIKLDQVPMTVAPYIPYVGPLASNIGSVVNYSNSRKEISKANKSEKTAGILWPAIGSLLGAAKAPEGFRTEGAQRGAFAGLGAMAGKTLGWIPADMLVALTGSKGKSLAGLLLGIAGSIGGGVAGYKGTNKLMGPASWE